ncbi:MAG: STAS domain-containing protein, partial [Verrucomicrobiota bacterium]
MPVSANRLSVAVEGPTAFVRVVGRGCAECAPHFKRAIERFRGEGVREVVLDLGACLLMDSTFAGVLAALATGAGAGARPLPFTAVNAAPRVVDLLDNLGIRDRFRLVSGPPGPGPEAGCAEELPAEPATREEAARCCLEAHRVL